MEVFFIRYRKMLLFGSFFMFFYTFYEIYGGIESIISGNTGRGTGALIDAFISLFLAGYFFINVRKANKAFKEANAINDDNKVGLN